MKTLLTGLLFSLASLGVIADDVIRADMALSPDGETAVTSTGAGSLLIWNTSPAWSLRQRLDLGDQRLFGFDFSDDGRLLGFGTQDGTLVVMNVADGSVVFTVDDRDGSVSAVRFGDGSSVFAAGQGDQVSQYDWQTGEQIASFELGADTEVEDFEVITGQGWLFVARFDEQARLMDIDTGELLFEWQNDRRERDGQRNVKGVEFLPDATRGYFGGVGGKIIEVDLVSGERLRELETHPDFISDLELSNDGATLIAADLDGNVVEVDTGTFTITRRYKQSGSFSSGRLLFAVDFSSDDTQIITGGINLPLIIWDRETGERLQTIDTIPETTAP